MASLSFKNLLSKVRPEAAKIPEEPKPKNPWKGLAVKGTVGGLAAGTGLGVLGHNLVSNVAPPSAPSPPSIYDANEYKTSAELMERLEKTAYKEESSMDLMERLEKTAGESQNVGKETSETLIDRLEKTANDMAIIQAISEATDIPPEQIVQLMQQHPEEFQELVQELQSQAQMPVDHPILHAAGQGIDLGGEIGSQGGAVVGGYAALHGAAPFINEGKSVVHQLGRGGLVGLGGALGGSALGGLAGGLLGGGVGAGVGAIKQLFHRDNPRAGAASVSDNPAGVDQTASEDIMERLEKTANEEKTRQGSNAGPGAAIGAGAGALAGAGGAAHFGNKMMNVQQNMLNDLKGVDVAALGNELGNELGDTLGNIKPQELAEELSAVLPSKAKALGSFGLLGGLGGAALGAGLGAGVGSLVPHYEQTANEDVTGMQKAALELGGMLSKVKNFAADATGHNYRAAKDVYDTHSTAEATAANAMKAGGPDKYRQHLEKLEGNVTQAKGDMNKALKQTAIGGGIGLAGLATGTALSNHDKQATEGAPSGMDGYDNLKTADSAAAASPATAEGPAGQEGLEGYESSKPEGKDKEASGNEEFMTGLYKEAAAHILNLDVPETKAYVNPMNRIKF